MTFEYEPAPESASTAGIREEYGLFVGGEFRHGDAGDRGGTVNPATGEIVARVAVAGPADVAAAVAAAREAFVATWSPMPGTERAKYLFRISRLITEHARELSALETIDTGKPIGQTRCVDVPLAAAHFFYNAGWADKLRYAVPGGLAADPRPLGVAAQVTSWNAPLAGLAGKVAAALACGDTVVAEPAESTPLSALALAELCQRAELPPGVFNVITGGEGTRRLLVGHPGVDVVSFSGSTAEGRQVARAAAGSGPGIAAGARRRLTLDLDTTAAMLVFDDAPVDEAIEGIVRTAFCRGSHDRGARPLLLVQESIAEEVLGALRARMERLRVGDPLDGGTDVGAVTSPAHFVRLRELVSEDIDEDTERWSPGFDLPDRGQWVAPTVFTGVSRAQRIVRSEVAGPVLPVLTFRTLDEAIEQANNTPFGLSASIWSGSGARVLAVAKALRAGVVLANAYHRFDPAAPLGANKESGYGVRGGRQGLEAYLATA